MLCVPESDFSFHIWLWLICWVQRIDFHNDWKVITMFIGGNDICDFCSDTVSIQLLTCLYEGPTGTCCLWFSHTTTETLTLLKISHSQSPQPPSHTYTHTTKMFLLIHNWYTLRHARLKCSHTTESVLHSLLKTLLYTTEIVSRSTETLSFTLQTSSHTRTYVSADAQLKNFHTHHWQAFRQTIETFLHTLLLTFSHALLKHSHTLMKYDWNSFFFSFRLPKQLHPHY